MARDWEAIKEVFASAVLLSGSARDDYLQGVGRTQPAVAAAVAELLRAHEEASVGFLSPGRLGLRQAWLFSPGTRVADRFRIVAPIARGAMGEVYEAHDERLGLSVALKAIRPELLTEPGSVERFRREVLVTREIAHENICRVFDLVEHRLPPSEDLPDGATLPCLTMQLLQGQSLEVWAAAHRPAPWSSALPLILQMASALQALHAAGVVHRDLKPSNVVLVEEDGGLRAVLTDFGLARPLDAGLFETQGSAHGGAPYFMAPELFRGERPSPASDLYAFGLLIDEMVTSRRAFSADSLHALLLQKLGEGPERPSQRARDLPRAWEDTILQCLAASPDDRPADALQVRERLLGTAKGARSWLTPRPGKSRALPYAVVPMFVLAGAAVAVGASQDVTRSVVIRPFKNLTGQADLDYLAVGTAGELGRRLSRVRNLHVYGPSDVEDPFTGRRRDTFALSGHVQEAGQRLRITVRLTDAQRGTLLWSQNRDGSRAQALTLEEELAADTVGALTRVEPPGGAGLVHRAGAWLSRALRPPRLPSTGTTSASAFDDYLRARALFEERTLQSALTAIRYLQSAIRDDPNFAKAYAALADVQGVLMDLHYAPHATLIDEMERYANQAVAVDPELPDAHLALAAVRQAQWRWDEADAAYRRAIELHPRFARAHRWHGGLLLQFGRFDQTLALYRRALDLDPYDYPSQSAYGHALFHAGRPLDAAAHLEAVLSRKDLFNAHAVLGQVYAFLGRDVSAEGPAFQQRALKEAEILRTREVADQPADAAVTPFADLVAALAYSYRRDLTNAAVYVARLERARDAKRVAPSTLARVYAAQGDSARAIAALLDAEADRDRELLYVNVSPYYAGIRNDPSFQALVARLQLAR